MNTEKEKLAEIALLGDFNRLLNEPPPHEVIVTDENAGFQYLPIDYIEDKLRELYFGMVELNVIEWREALDEVTAHVRITVTHPVNGRILTYDGLASTEITIINKLVTVETNTNFKSKIIEAPSLKLDLPKVYSLAIKNAAKKIGRAFGSDLNRNLENETFINPEEKKLTKEEEKAEVSGHAVNNFKQKLEEGKKNREEEI